MESEWGRIVRVAWKRLQPLWYADPADRRTKALTVQFESNRARVMLCPHLRICRNRLQPERVLSRRDHRQQNGGLIRLGFRAFGLEPCIQPRIVDLRPILPEVGVKSALNLQMIQLQFDDRCVFGKITARVTCAYMQSCQPMTLTLRFDNHIHLPSANNAQASLGSEIAEARYRSLEPPTGIPIWKCSSRNVRFGKDGLNCQRLPCQRPHTSARLADPSCSDPFGCAPATLIVESARYPVKVSLVCSPGH